MRKLLVTLIIALFSLLWGGFCRAQVITACRDSVKGGYNFWLYTPQGYLQAPDSVKRKTPLILFLHGGSLIGRNMYTAIRYGTIDAIKRGQKIDAVVIQPQTFGKESGMRTAWNPDRLINILDWAKGKVPYDTTRVYVLGMSTGGVGTLEFSCLHPERVAAAMAVCGSVARPSFASLDEVPLWLIHGTSDEVINASRSQVVFNWLHTFASGSRVRLDFMEGYDHSKVVRLFYTPMTYDWLFRHSLSQEGRPVDTTITLTQRVIDRAYMDVDESFKDSLNVVDNP